jgi:hypothetical protein
LRTHCAIVAPAAHLLEFDDLTRAPTKIKRTVMPAERHYIADVRYVAGMDSDARSRIVNQRCVAGFAFAIG